MDGYTTPSVKPMKNLAVNNAGVPPKVTASGVNTFTRVKVRVRVRVRVRRVVGFGGRL